MPVIPPLSRCLPAIWAVKYATKTHPENEDDEAERLVRSAPKLKPPRKDKRRENMELEDNKDADLDSKDMSLNYKVVGNVVSRYAGNKRIQQQSKLWRSRNKNKVPAINKQTGDRVFVSPQTLKEEPGKYEPIKKKDDDKPSKMQGDAEGETQPKGQAQPKAAPEGGASSGGEKPKDDLKKEAPKSSEKENKEPSESEKLGIPEPKRREASREEYAKASLALVDNLPPKLAAQLMVKRVHPDDVQDLISNYKAAQARKIGDTSKFVQKVSSIYQTDPDRVTPPATGLNAAGKKVAFESLSPEERAAAYRKHQMQVLAVSLAAQAQLSEKLGSLVPKSVAVTLSDTLLTKGGKDSEKLAQQVYDTVVKSKDVHPMTPKQGRRLLELVESNPEAKKQAQSFLEANDYNLVKKELLESGKVTEDSPTHVIVDGLRTAREQLNSRAKTYGLDSHQGADRFQRKVLEQLKNLDENKYAEVRQTFDLIERRDYEKASKAYEKAKKKYDSTKKQRASQYQKALRKWHSMPVSDRGDEPPPPEPPPKPPTPPLGLSNTKTDKELQDEGRSLWKDLFGSSSTKMASSVVYRHLISSYLKGMAMSTESRKNLKVGLYLGIDPAINYPEGPYRGWQQAHQRDLGESDYDLILGSAQEWLGSPVLSLGVEGMVPDQRYRHALDLAIQSSPYNRAIDIPTYNTLLARLQKVDEPGFDQSGLPTLRLAATDRAKLEKKVYSKFPPDSRMKRGGRLQVMLTGNTASKLKKPNYELVFLDELSDKDLDTLADMFKVRTASTNYVFHGEGALTPDVIEALEGATFLYRDDEGATHEDGRLSVKNTDDNVVSMSFPEGSDEEAFQAIQDIARKHDLNVEKTARATSYEAARRSNPTTFRASMSWDTNPEDRNGDRQMLKLSSENQKTAANNILGRFDALAGKIQEKYASWGLSHDQAKELVNSIDKLADDTEAFIYGDDSLQRRQAEIAVETADFAKEAKELVGEEVFTKAAAVLQRDSDEPYMDTFQNPHQPVQTDADEPYMNAYSDDQSSAIVDGEDATGRDLAPEA